MLFNSLEFLLFGVVFFGVWPLLRKKDTTRWFFITGMSFVFYGWWDWRFLFLIIASGALDYWAGLAMVRWPGRSKLFLCISLFGNIASLSVFKYLDFAIHNANWLLSFFGVEHEVPAAGLILPVAISFYTFQSMSYSIDVYRGLLKPTRNILHFFAYLAMFPQLMAGPIVRAADILPQLEKNHRATRRQVWDGLVLLAMGFFKKTVIADQFAPIINKAFGDSVVNESGLFWWMIMLMFAFQIYCDFSGYSDIARGLAKWMGYEFHVNFDHPYIAQTMREFWSRWHISLSTWFRDYLYIPLGGSRKGVLRSHINLWITMLAAGLWHGASWHFVIWGAMHAMFLSVERQVKWYVPLLKVPAGKYICRLIVFILVLTAWVFFRSEDVHQACDILGRMYSPMSGKFNPGIDIIKILPMLVLIIGRQVYIAESVQRRWLVSNKVVRLWLYPAAIAFLLFASIFLAGSGDAFIYFQF